VHLSLLLPSYTVTSHPPPSQSSGSSCCPLCTPRQLSAGCGGQGRRPAGRQAGSSIPHLHTSTMALHIQSISACTENFKVEGGSNTWHKGGCSCTSPTSASKRCSRAPCQLTELQAILQAKLQAKVQAVKDKLLTGACVSLLHHYSNSFCNPCFLVTTLHPHGCVPRPVVPLHSWPRSVRPVVLYSRPSGSPLLGSHGRCLWGVP
jgi:hypothetical protein